VDRRRIVWSYAITVGIYHMVALLALLPWFFSWTGVVLVVLGLYVFGTLGINLCYHWSFHMTEPHAIGGFVARAMTRTSLQEDRFVESEDRALFLAILTALCDMLRARTGIRPLAESFLNATSAKLIYF
jgi:hypothetical protein